jgi:glutamate racemase
MTTPMPVFIADTCIGGLSVVKSMWDAGHAADAIFLADYQVNPLGVKSDSEIDEVAGSWLEIAQQHSDTLVIACNTLSVRYHQLIGVNLPYSDLAQVVSMVDCFKAMINAEAGSLDGKKILIMGTEFTASQNLYPEIIRDALPGARVESIGATELERRIARFQPWESDDDSVLTRDLRSALEDSDIAILACTCFPMVRAELQALFPGVGFLDPGAYCAGLLPGKKDSRDSKVSLKLGGKVVTAKRVVEFAKSYLHSGSIVAV